MAKKTTKKTWTVEFVDGRWAPVRGRPGDFMFTRGQAGAKARKLNVEQFGHKYGPISNRRSNLSIPEYLLLSKAAKVFKPGGRLRANVAAGFIDEDGVFHPIRKSWDYSYKRAGEKFGGTSKKAAAARRKFGRRVTGNNPGLSLDPLGQWIRTKAVRVRKIAGKTILDLKR